jgi:hypothetical protein
VKELSDLSDRELLLDLRQVEEAVRRARLPDPRPPAPAAATLDESAWGDVSALLAYQRRIVKELRRRRHLGDRLAAAGGLARPETEAHQLDDGASSACEDCIPVVKVARTDNDTIVQVCFHSSGCPALQAMPADERVAYPDPAAVVVHISEDQTRDWPAGEG